MNARRDTYDDLRFDAAGLQDLKWRAEDNDRAVVSPRVVLALIGELERLRDTLRAVLCDR